MPIWKRLLFWTVAATSTVVLAEVVAHIGYAVTHGELFPLAAVDQEMAAAARTESAAADAASADGEPPQKARRAVDVIHPYLGFVHDPDRSAYTSPLGFHVSRADPLKRRAPNTAGKAKPLRIAFFGGSFAEGTILSGRQVLAARLLEAGYSPEVFVYALGGYKQPQQLAALSYLLSLGADYDVVVNLDGFNEVALPWAENLTSGVNPYYPRGWRIKTAGLSDPGMVALYGEIAVLETRRREWARRISGYPSLSIIRNLIWRTRDASFQEQIASATQQVMKTKPAVSAGFTARGPKLDSSDWKLLDAKLVEHWGRSSRLMKGLCDASGIKYIHLLQPNQYYEPGRELTPVEQRTAFRKDHIYRSPVVRGYPLLREEGEQLTRDGVDFHDLTLVYRDTPEPVYRDTCCHPNRYGYEIIASEVADAVLAAIGGGGDGE